MDKGLIVNSNYSFKKILLALEAKFLREMSLGTS